MDQATADLNNAAVAHFNSGDLGRAFDLFRCALQQTMDGNHHLGAQSPAALPSIGTAPPQDQSMSAPAPSDSDRGSGISSGSSCPPANAGRTDFKINTCMPFIHAKCFGIVGTPGAYSPDPLINTTIVSTLVVFNLALLYHIKGTHEKALCERRLCKSHALYSRAHLILSSAGAFSGCTGNAVVDLLSMAVFNNLAHVSYELAEYDQSRTHFDALIRFALTVVPSRYGDPSVGPMMEEQKSNFLLNAIILHAPSLSPAA